MKIYFFFFEGWISVSPTVIGICRLLAERDFTVHVFARIDKDVESYDFDDERIIVHYSGPVVTSTLLRTLLSRLKLRTIVNLLELGWFVVQTLFQILGLKNPRKAYVLGVDTNGSVAAWLVSMLLRVKISYLSLEMTIREKYRNIDCFRLYLESKAFRASQFLIIQDKNRFEKICETHRFNHPNPLYVANSGSERGRTESTFCGFFENRFGLRRSDFDCFVLHAGMICDKVLSKQIVTAFSEITSIRTALILHERFKREVSDPYIHDLLGMNNRNLFLSLEPVPFEQIGNVFCAVDIGLVIYDVSDRNFENIGKASGKLAQYLKYGVPVLMSNIESLAEMNAMYGFGEIVFDPKDSGEIQRCLVKIMKDYGVYRENALDCFAKEFDMRSQFEPFATMLKTYKSDFT